MKLRYRVLLVILMLCLLLFAYAVSPLTPRSRQYYKGPVSDHFDGERFFNPEGEFGTGGAQKDGLSDFLRIALGREHSRPWPASLPVYRSVPPKRVEGGAMRVTWIGHATTLVQTQGLNILIDPVWAMRDSPFQFVGPRRVRMPGVQIEDLPPIDIILISHNHYDHMDIGALRFLATRDHPLIVTGLGNDTLLAQYGLKAVAGDWGRRIVIRPGIAIVLTRAHHWSARWIDDRDRSLWVGFRVTLPGGDLYYSGDTGPGDMRWAAEAKGAAPIRLAILPIAPYKIDAPQTGNHIDPAMAVSVFRKIGAAYALGVHWGTFELGSEGPDDPPKRLHSALLAAKIASERFRALSVGGSWAIPTLHGITK
jgi:L-ascorbate metabolism protein UlaG (beta-lactamase superfamily)